MVYVMEGLDIPEGELSFTTSRSSGPGGQNVNKVSTRVTLLFDVGGVECSLGAAAATAARSSSRADQPGGCTPGGVSSVTEPNWPIARPLCGGSPTCCAKR